jgi:hypothetical protein
LDLNKSNAKKGENNERRGREFIVIRRFQIWKDKGNYTKKTCFLDLP